MAETVQPAPPAPWRFFLYSGVGIFMFFIPITIGESTTIPLDHLVTFIRELLGGAVPYVALAIIAGGAVYPFASGRWKQSALRTVFAVLNLVGLAAALMIVFGFGPAFLHDPDLGPFLYHSLVVPVGFIVPIGAIFLAMLVGYAHGVHRGAAAPAHASAVADPGTLGHRRRRLLRGQLRVGTAHHRPDL